MIHLRRALPVARLDVPMFVAALDPLLRSLRSLKFDDEGRLITTDGRTLDGLQVTEGTHPRPGTSYRIVTRSESPISGEKVADGQEVEPAKRVPGWQRITVTSGQVRTIFAKYDAHLVADDADLIELGVEGYGSPVQIRCTLPEPSYPTRLEFQLSGHLDDMWPIRGPITGSAQIVLNQFPPARGGKPQVTAKFRHRYAAGRLAVVVTPGTDGQWLAAVDVHLRFRGVFLLATPFSAFFRTKLQREFDAFDPEELAQFVERFGAASDPAAMAATAVDALLACIAETVQPD